MSCSIGKKTTFWRLVKDKITIPTLQRDYIYGAGTPKTEEVLGNMLETFKHAVITKQEVTLDFVYGSESKAKEFMPLDGQQRLTTLYLLHYYAAIVSGNLNSEGSNISEATGKDFDILSRFSYATRNCTIAFCNKLLIDKHKEIGEAILNAKPGDTTAFSTYLKDLDDFRGAFYTDPSVMSMIAVLDRIHNEFGTIPNLWPVLTSEECPINFYQLDFGIFDLSDDLYSKMNSRGKPLTTFEIFKAKMHKHIKKLDKKRADAIAIKLDTHWMQLIWETLDHTPELKKVDPAYIFFFKNVFRSFDFLAGYGRDRFNQLDDACLECNMQSTWRIKAMESVFDTFCNKADNIPAELATEYKQYLAEAVSSDLKNNRLLLLYSLFLGLYLHLDKQEFCYRFRHVRNLTNNSPDQIREENMKNLLGDVTKVMKGKILLLLPKALNKNSWNEEQEKEKHRDVWSSLFEYEDIGEINGTIQAFCSRLNQEGTFDLGDEQFVSALTERLKKAKHFFCADNIHEPDRRSALLSLGGYFMCKINYPAYKYIGIIKGSWNNFTGFHRFDERHNIMHIIDKIDLSKPIAHYVKDTRNIEPENWRYYVVKYPHIMTVAYSSNDYGYIYLKDIDKDNPYSEDIGYLDAIVLQSSYYSATNVAWKIIHRLLDMQCRNQYNMYLNHMGGDMIRLPKISNEAMIDMQTDGWHIIGLPLDHLEQTGLQYTIITHPQEEEKDGDGNIITSKQVSDCLVKHELGTDFVEEGANILNLLSLKYPGLRKEQ